MKYERVKVLYSYWKLKLTRVCNQLKMTIIKLVLFARFSAKKEIKRKLTLGF